ncbi:MAG: NYN domain-containing protein [Lachnospiraceae bacterium]|nr:NYN domain-containing protein [Lachnospiraceae bacterium]
MQLEENRDINLALLIDVDNVAARYIESILSELSKYGKVTIRRMYGDWSQNRLKRWLNVASRYSLTPVMQANNTPGKNASDIGLIIDAMDILYTGGVEGFCIVSSDSDFNYLATRIREAGKVVIGMGEKKTPEAFRASCERFIFLDVLQSEAEQAEDQPEDDMPSHAGAQDVVSKKALENTIINMINDNTAQGKETGLGEIGSRLTKIYPDFDIRNYNYSKLSTFVKDFASLTVETRDFATWVSLKVSSLSDVEDQIQKIYADNATTVMNIGRLKDELEKINPSLNATIRQNGVTKFSAFLERKISCVRIVGNTEAELAIDTAQKSTRKRATRRKKSEG